MTDLSTFEKAMWFEEFEPGQKLVSKGRNVSETDLVDFAALTGDTNPIHLDQEYAAKSVFGQRVAHGLLGLSFALGLVIQTGLLDGTIDAFREIKNWKFKRPVFIDDTIRVILTVKKTQPLKGLGSGIVHLAIKVVNQDDLAVMFGQLSILMKNKPV